MMQPSCWKYNKMKLAYSQCTSIHRGLAKTNICYLSTNMYIRTCYVYMLFNANWLLRNTILSVYVRT